MDESPRAQEVRLARAVAMAAVEWLASGDNEHRFAHLEALVARWKEAVLDG